MREIKKQEGFVAITSVLIINALILVLGISLFHASLTDQSVSSSYDSGEEASVLADACVREACFKLKENINYAGDESININGMSCAINPIGDVNDYTKRISTLARAGDRPHFKRAEEEIRYAIESKAEDWICDGCVIENLEIVGNSLTLSEALGAGEEIEGVTRTIATATEWTGENNYYSITNLKADGDDLVLEENQTQGHRISNPLSLNEVKYVESSKIEWDETLEIDTKIDIYTKVVESETTPVEAPETWQTATNGQSIPEIEAGADLTNHWLWVKQELKTIDPSLTPRLHSLTEMVTKRELVPIETEGYRISSELNISGEGKVKDSQIFWQAETRLGAPIVIETRFYNGEVWTDWEVAKNGREVPGLSRGLGLETALLQTRATFTGGPGFYPSLKNINIFIEIKR